MPIDINIWAVIAAALTSFLLGGLWYSSRPVRAWSIDGGYHTLQFVLYRVVLGLWH